VPEPARYGPDVTANEAASSPAPRRHLGAGAALSVTADVGALVAAAVVSIVLARDIGPSANGTYAVILTLVNIAVLIGSLGLTAGITYGVSRGHWPLREAIRTALCCALLLGLLGTAASLGFYLATEHSAMRHVAPHLALIALPMIPAAMAWQFATAILLGRDRYEGYTALLLINAAATLILTVGLALAFGLTGAVIGVLVSNWLTAIAGTWLLRRSIHEERNVLESASPEAPHLRKAFRFGLQAWVGNIVQQANYRLDLLVLGGYAAASHVGVYSVAVTITAISWVLPHGLQTVLFPRTASLDSAVQAGHLEAAESDAAAARATRHSVLLVVPAGAIVAVLLGLVPLVYGPKFTETVWLGFVLLPGVLALGVGKVVGSVVTGRGGPRYMMYTGCIGAAVTIALYFILIPSNHEWGAAAASTISYVFTTALVVFFFRRVAAIPLRTALLPTRADLHNYSEALSALRMHVRSRRAERQAA
jgi:O-antigen/teichoic acid export membrane protein